MRPSLPSEEVIAANVASAIAEDLGDRDLTAELIPPDQQLAATIMVREDAVLCGQRWADIALAQVASYYGAAAAMHWRFSDGDPLTAGVTVAELEGQARTLLTAERTILNFLQLLSGTASTARHRQSLLAGTDCALLDTRKTVPGLRAAQKYAVACGGATNHRHGLFDGYLIKENHIRACGSITAAVHSAQRSDPARPIEVEVETIDQLREAISAGADIALIDNFSADNTSAAVALAGGRIRLEASGGLESDDDLLRTAGTGVDFVSSGALTKHVRAVDYSMRFTARP